MFVGTNYEAQLPFSEVFKYNIIDHTYFNQIKNTHEHLPMFASTPQNIHRTLSFVGVSALLPYVKSMETSMPKGPKHAVKKRCDFTQPKCIFRRSGNNKYVLELHFAK